MIEDGLEDFAYEIHRGVIVIVQNHVERAGGVVCDVQPFGNITFESLLGVAHGVVCYARFGK